MFSRPVLLQSQQSLFLSQTILQSFKGDPHSIVGAFKAKRADNIEINLYLNDRTSKRITVTDLRNTEAQYAKKNIDDITLKQHVAFAFDGEIDNVGKDNISHPILVKEVEQEPEQDVVEKEEIVQETKEKEEVSFEQISIFDDLD